MAPPQRHPDAPSRYRRAHLHAAAFVLMGSLPFAAGAGQIDIDGPPGSGAFGSFVFALPNGNVAVADPDYDDGAITDVGAVHLYSTNGSHISTLTGSSAGDRIGSGRVYVLDDGDVIVLSPDWSAGRGAVTRIDGVAGLDAAVDASNSLVGTVEGSRVGGNNLFRLAGGQVVVRSSFWTDDASRPSLGAVTWIGDAPVTGPVSAANSLVGSTAGDTIGGSRVVPLANGHYVVGSPSWSNGGVAGAGAATWGNGTTGIVGVVSATNSLVGSTAGDNVGERFWPLSTGDYVVITSSWYQSAAVPRVGAVTWADGDGPTTGTVSAANSLVGASGGDRIGSGGVVELTGGAYLVLSPSWTNGTALGAGAITWQPGGAAVGDVVGAGNSVVGSTAFDGVGSGRWRTIGNGRAVVGSPDWDNGAAVDAGAATWIDGSATVGPVSAANSLVGASSNDGVGDGITALPGGNFIVNTPLWDDAGIADVGAVTWGSSSAGVTGVVSAANSLVGGTAGDQVGRVVLPFAGGDALVLSPAWDFAGISDVGAATRIDGSTPASGTIGPGNSLIGSLAGDAVGDSALRLLDDHFVLHSGDWNGGAGAVTWVDVDAPLLGTVGPDNSVVGSVAGDRIGETRFTSVYGLHSGRYVVLSSSWDDGARADAGAITLLDGNGPSSGPLAATSSIVGRSGDLLGSPPCNPGPGCDWPSNGYFDLFTDGAFVVWSPLADHGGLADVGAITLVTGDTPQVQGRLNAYNSVFGGVAGGGRTMTHDYDITSRRLVVGRPAENRVSVRDLIHAPTTTSLQGAAESTVYETVAVAATIGAAGATGTVSFRVDGVEVAACEEVALAAGSAACELTGLAPGTHGITARYSGDADHAPSEASIVHEVRRIAQAITFDALADRTIGAPGFTLAASGGSSGQPVVFASLTPAACTTAGTHGADVTIGLPGTCTIRATQAGSADHAPAPAVERTFAVRPAITLFADSERPTEGTSLLLIATVNGNAPTGSVAFLAGDATITGCEQRPLVGSGDLTVASCAATLPLGTHPVTAVYVGDAGNPSASSAEVTVQVVPPRVFADGFESPPASR